MPALTSAQIKPIVTAAFATRQFTGEKLDKLAEVIADSISQSLSIFIAQVKVIPGIPVAAPPPALSGSTVGPGNLMNPPSKAQIKPVVAAGFTKVRFTGDNIDDLADVIADTIAQGLTMFTAQVKVAPGIPITGGVTTGPGMLM